MRPSEKEIIERLQTARMQYAPLMIASIDIDSGREGDRGFDAVIEFSIENGPSFRALAEVVSPASPKAVSQFCARIRDSFSRRQSAAAVPMIVAPYISAEQSDILSQAGVSWLDLSGNMVIRVAGRIYIERTGRPNRFPDTAPIKKIFQGTASLVARALLLEPTGFTSVSQIVECVERRGGAITLSTVSKVLMSLEEELLVARSRRAISVSAPRQLLDRLAAGYAASRSGARMTTHHFAVEEPETMLARLCLELGSTYVFCGFYAAQLKGLAAGGRITMSVSDMNRFRGAAKSLASAVCPDEEFGNLSVIETRSCLPWFNADTSTERRVVDDLQLYLEMMSDTPRGPKIAEVLRRRILREDRDG